MAYTPEIIEKKARENEKANRELIKILKKKPPRDLDEIAQTAHDTVFERIDCLSCANCCRTLGPRITEKDIERISKYLRIKSAAFIQAYLRIDEDSDFVFKQMPCPFLEKDNTCRIYEHRPKACREYPHTDRKNFHQILDLTLKNAYVCPAVIDILSVLRVWKGIQ